MHVKYRTYVVTCIGPTYQERNKLACPAAKMMTDDDDDNNVYDDDDEARAYLWGQREQHAPQWPHGYYGW